MLNGRSARRQGLCDHGAASGIGAETARLFAEEGARVVGVDLAEGAEGELALQADVADEDSVREMYAKAAE